MAPLNVSGFAFTVTANVAVSVLPLTSVAVSVYVAAAAASLGVSCSRRIVTSNCIPAGNIGSVAIPGPVSVQCGLPSLVPSPSMSAGTSAMSMRTATVRLSIISVVGCPESAAAWMQ